MGTAKLTIPPEFDAAPSEDRVAFVQELWDRIASEPEKVPIPDHHKRLLDDRLKEYRANPEAGVPWGEIRDRLLAKLRDR